MIKCFSTLRSSLAADFAKTLVVAAAHDEHTLEAVYSAVKELPVRYVLVGNREKIMTISSGLNHIPNADTIVDAADDAECAQKAIALIREGGGDILMKGLLETGILLKSALDREHGIRESGVMSHLAMLDIPGYHKLLGVTDGGMIPCPTLSQKVNIIHNTVAFYGKLGFPQVKIAAVCAAESVSANIRETVDAAELQVMCEMGQFGDNLVEGPLSLDIAISRESASIKKHSSRISGDTDVLLVPNIVTGNVFGKGLIYWGGAKMAGCILGAKAPFIVVSRGATSEEKLCSIMLCLAAARSK